MRGHTGDSWPQNHGMLGHERNLDRMSETRDISHEDSKTQAGKCLTSYSKFMAYLTKELSFLIPCPSQITNEAGKEIYTSEAEPGVT